MSEQYNIDDQQRGLGVRWQQPPSPYECPSYQGPMGASFPKGYTYWTQQAVPIGKTGGRSRTGKEMLRWEVTVYYTNIKDPLAPLKPSTLPHHISTHLDLREKRIHWCEYTKRTIGRNSIKYEKVDMEERIEDIPPEDKRRAASVEEENRIRAIKRKQRQEKVKKLDEARRIEKQHMELIEKARRKAKAEEVARLEEKEKAVQKAKEAARSEEEEKVARYDEEIMDLIKVAEFLEGEEVERVATDYRAAAKTFVDNSTEPKHLAEAVEMLCKSQLLSSDDDDAIFKSAADKQAGFIEEIIDKILTRPQDASIKTRKKDLHELGCRLQQYQELGGDDETIEERAMTKLKRLKREIRQLKERKDSQALQGQTQIHNPQRGLNPDCRNIHR